MYFLVSVSIFLLVAFPYEICDNLPTLSVSSIYNYARKSFWAYNMLTICIHFLYRHTSSLLCAVVCVIWDTLLSAVIIQYAPSAILS